MTFRYILGYSIKRYVLYIFILNSLHIYAQNQDKNTNTISIGLGYNTGFLNDANYSPLNYKQNGGDFFLTYKRLGDNEESIFGIQVNANFLTLSTEASNFFATDMIQGQLCINYIKKIKELNSKSNLYLGVGLSSKVKSLDWENTESFSYFAVHSFVIRGSYQSKITDRLSLDISISIPFVSFLARPPYNGINEEIIDNQDNIIAIITKGEVESFNTYFNIDSEFDFSYTLSKSIAVNAKISFDYNTIYSGNAWTQFQVVTNTGLTYNF